MLLEKIKDDKQSLNLLMAYLKDNKYDINTFFTKIPIKFQFIIISHWLTINYNIGILITPISYIIYRFIINPFNQNYNQVLIEIDHDDITDEIYEYSIKTALLQLTKILNIPNNDNIPF